MRWLDLLRISNSDFLKIDYQSKQLVKHFKVHTICVCELRDKEWTNKSITDKERLKKTVRHGYR